jgi:hypothetical protein
MGAAIVPGQAMQIPWSHPQITLQQPIKTASTMSSYQGAPQGRWPEDGGRSITFAANETNKPTRMRSIQNAVERGDAKGILVF